MKKGPLPPIERSVTVSWSPEAAFDRFTREFASWWPSRTHSIGGERLARVVLETQVGGRIYEEHVDGRRFQWGVILEWEPPARLKFTWHPSRDPATAQVVEVRFLPEDSGTRVVLSACDWEKWGPGAARARRGYSLGWQYVLHVWAQRRTPGMVALDVLGAGIRLVERLRGGAAASIARAGGEMPRQR